MSGTSGEKHKQSLHVLRDMLLIPKPTRVPGDAMRGTHRWSAVRSSQPDLRSLGLQRQDVQGSHGASDVVDLTGLSATLPLDIASVQELWTPQALAMKREKTVSASDISKYEATLKAHRRKSCRQILRGCIWRELIKEAYAA